jgi:hypothetical protein
MGIRNGEGKLKMKPKSILLALIWINFGMLIESLIYHFRFNNELLRREMLLLMQNGNSYSYFLSFACMNFIILIIGSAFYFYLYRRRKHGSKN